MNSSSRSNFLELRDVLFCKNNIAYHRMQADILLTRFYWERMHIVNIDVLENFKGEGNKLLYDTIYQRAGSENNTFYN